MKVRGIRGAITVSKNEEEEILAATEELFLQICKENQLQPDDVASIFITMTKDLNATFPAKAIRSRPDWELVPIMCAVEVDVPGALEKCIRFLVHVNTDQSQDQIRHVFLREAVGLRPDLVNRNDWI
jgi:chorismate mutase